MRSEDLADLYLSHGIVICVHFEHHAGGETESQNKLPKKYGSYMKKSQ